MSSDESTHSDDEILGVTTISDRWRISLIKDVRDAFAESNVEVEEGDKLVYRLRDGEIVIESA